MYYKVQFVLLFILEDKYFGRKMLCI